MTPAELTAQPETKRLRQVLTDLSLVSHVRGTSYDATGGGARGDSSGGPPPNGPDHRGDREDGFRQKTEQVFLRRYARLVESLDRVSDERAQQIRDAILGDAEQALRAWRKSPSVPGQDPDRGTLEWKKRVARDGRPSRRVAAHYGVSHVTVLRIRREYAGVE